MWSQEVIETIAAMLVEYVITSVHRWIRKKYITILRTQLNQGKVPSLKDIAVLAKDKDFVFVNKVCDIAINCNIRPDGTVEHSSMNVALQLEYLYPDLVDKQLINKFRNVHRLDYATSGVYCVALNKKACAKAMKAFQRRKTVKHYLAMVRGHMPVWYTAGYTIDVSIGKDGREGMEHRMCVQSTNDCRDSKHASTVLVLLEHGLYMGQPASKVLLIPNTGRRHQLRVHCSHLGHTIVGDYTYSNKMDVRPYRMMLHAYRLILPLPNKTYDVISPDPFVNAVDRKWKPDKVFWDYTDYLSGTEAAGVR